MASAVPARIERRGTSASSRRRPGTSSFATCAPPSNTVAAASAANAVVEPVTNAQTPIAAQTSNAPGTTGTTTPAMPTAIARPTTAVQRSLMRGSARVAAGRSAWRGWPHRYGAQRARSRVLDSPRDIGGDAHDLAGARDARLHRAEEEPGPGPPG